MFQTCPMTCVQRTECPTFLPSLLSNVCQTSLVTHLGMSVIVPVTHLCTNPSADQCETIFKRHPGFTGCWSNRTNNGHVVKPCALNHNCKSPCAFNRGHLIIRKKMTQTKKQKTSNIWSFLGGLKFDPYPHLFVVGLSVAACQCGACQTRIFLNEGNAFRFVIDEGHNVHLARHTKWDTKVFTRSQACIHYNWMWYRNPQKETDSLARF